LAAAPRATPKPPADEGPAFTKLRAFVRAMSAPRVRAAAASAAATGGAGVVLCPPLGARPEALRLLPPRGPGGVVAGAPPLVAAAAAPGRPQLWRMGTAARGRQKKR